MANTDADELTLMSDWASFFDDLAVLNVDVDNRHNSEEQDLGLLLERIDASLGTLTYLLHEILLEQHHEAAEKVEAVVRQFEIYRQDLLREQMSVRYNPRLAIFQGQQEKCQGPGPGRPKYVIREETLVSFRDLGFSWGEIAQMLLVSRWTIYRRVEELGLQNVCGYSTITDDELDALILEYKSSHGVATGRSMVIGFLRSRGIRIQQRRVTKSLVRIDPANSRIRWASVIHRRTYQVPGPNSLWHADGYHALVRWKFVIHGAIDGYSRLIIYLKCSTNNRKETVADLFDLALAEYGAPSRVRTDKGGENVLIWQRMEEIRGVNRGSYLASSSVHNQRIERLWRDVWNSVACEFYYTFQAMEEQGILNPDNNVHLYVLHYIYLPRINKVVDSFLSSWNNHPLRTERNWSPRRLWINGMVDQRHALQHQVAEHQAAICDATADDLQWYGMDWHAPRPTDDGLSTVEVENIPCPLSADQMAILHETDCLRLSHSYGMDIFYDTMEALFT